MAPVNWNWSLQKLKFQKKNLPIIYKILTKMRIKDTQCSASAEETKGWSSEKSQQQMFHECWNWLKPTVFEARVSHVSSQDSPRLLSLTDGCKAVTVLWQSVGGEWRQSSGAMWPCNLKQPCYLHVTMGWVGSQLMTLWCVQWVPTQTERAPCHPPDVSRTPELSYSHSEWFD